jgi:hypothetical protein
MTRKKDEWITVAQAAVIAGCTDQTIRNRARDDRGSTKKEGRRRMVRRSWAETLVVGRGGTTAAAQIEGLKTRLAAAEHERDGGIVLFNSLREQLQAAKKERDQAITARDKWAKDHARQKKEIDALKLELQTYADTYAESQPPAVIDRLVSAVESAPLQTLMQIDQPRHAALRRVVHLWTAVQHAVESFTPGDSAQTNNNDEVT